ncbi:nucleotide sugar dehydrogenase [Desulfoluna spongiiphila]|uniref:UDP-N-acetyl-D-galactosamine dehydrogenase n=1 Tax=Desulfoluna spongiiphila TaxID=419481 RepID=A0A1G5D8F7_9BACT|nr:nucleotide sugar dehydrogenase [Desulfoluna spongiiphila]SCY10827.1 UDP-N-acetyl-D-galactosamine dehydrogenase [Desulfoluna spongiiphila]
MINNPVIAIIGLGYVGLPLALEFGKQYETIGFDIKASLVENCRNGVDNTGEVDSADFKAAVKFTPTSDPTMIGNADFIIVAVPTPINEAHQPDFTPLISSSETVGRHMSKGAVVIYESTVFPGATEDICVPILEKESGKTWKKDFNVGYSPERINPGDKVRTLTTITKVVSGDTPETLDKVKDLYGSIITAGVHPTTTIKEAEAAKVIENTQRDLNIALINELAIIFDTLNIDTLNVLEAAGTKWNFLPFRPGLVGGHCIGVDPYYLTYKAQIEGYHPEVILSGRKRNDSMGKYIAQTTVKRLMKNGCLNNGSSVAVLGLTFKEDCPDLRNTRVVDIVEEFQSYGIHVHVHDSQVDPLEAKRHYGIELTSFDDIQAVDAVVIATAHREYKEMPLDAFTEKIKANGSLIDVKSVLDPDEMKAWGGDFWRL